MIEQFKRGHKRTAQGFAGTATGLQIVLVSFIFLLCLFFLKFGCLKKFGKRLHELGCFFQPSLGVQKRLLELIGGLLRILKILLQPTTNRRRRFDLQWIPKKARREEFEVAHLDTEETKEDFILLKILFWSI